MSQRHKIFGIGFHKTGTKSLAAALKHLGYRVTGSSGLRDPSNSQAFHDQVFARVNDYDAFQDNPWPLLFRELDNKYPQSKFILTVRPTEDWIGSVVLHFGTQDTPMRKWIYGAGHPKGNEDLYMSRYEKHNREVLAHFKDRPNDLLVYRITEGDGWGPLCSFLGQDIPAVEFPYENRASNRSGFRHLLRRLREHVVPAGQP